MQLESPGKKFSHVSEMSKSPGRRSTPDSPAAFALLSVGRNVFLREGLSHSIRRTRYRKWEHLPVWCLSAAHHPFRISPRVKKKSSWLGLLTVKVRSLRGETSQSEKNASRRCRTSACPDKQQKAPAGASFNPCGFTPWPATPAFAFHVNIGRNDTLAEHGCYYGLPTTQRSSAPLRPEEGRHCLHPDQNDRRHFISAFLQRLRGGECWESLLRVYKGRADPYGLVESSKPLLVFYFIFYFIFFTRGEPSELLRSHFRLNVGGAKLHKCSETCHISGWWTPEFC